MVASNGNAEYAKTSALTAMATVGIKRFVPETWFTRAWLMELLADCLVKPMAEALEVVSSQVAYQLRSLTALISALWPRTWDSILMGLPI